MGAHRIAVAIVLLWSAACLALATVVFVNLSAVDPPERYIFLGLGLVMLYMGGALLYGVFAPAKPKDPDAPIVIPPLDQVRGRTRYRDDSATWRNGLVVIGSIFLFASIGAAREQPILLVIALVAVGVLCGAGVVIWRQIQYGRARLELDAPARRGDTMRGVITASGFAWTVVDRDIRSTVELTAVRSYRGGRSSSSVVLARESVRPSTTRDGKVMTWRFSTVVPVIDTSEGRFSWNVELETRSPKYRATFVVDVA